MCHGNAGGRSLARHDAGENNGSSYGRNNKGCGADLIGVQAHVAWGRIRIPIACVIDIGVVKYASGANFCGVGGIRVAFAADAKERTRGGGYADRDRRYGRGR